MVGDQMLPSPAGRLVAQLWEEIATATPHVSLDTIQLMPDHLHAILCLSGDTVSLSQLVHRFKAVSTAQYADGVHQADWPPFPGRLWQRGFYDRVIRREEELARTRDYILQNPLRWSLKRQ
jgi:REP element-mobilizing transposase RayT